jgi:hypothetical protein
MVTVYCPGLVSKRSSFWNRERDAFLRTHYNERVKVDPAMLAMSLRMKSKAGTREVIRRLFDLKLRDNCTDYLQRST